MIWTVQTSDFELDILPFKTFFQKRLNRYDILSDDQILYSWFEQIDSFHHHEEQSCHHFVTVSLGEDKTSIKAVLIEVIFVGEMVDDVFVFLEGMDVEDGFLGGFGKEEGGVLEVGGKGDVFVG